MKRRIQITKHTFLTALLGSSHQKSMEENFSTGKIISQVLNKLKNNELSPEEADALNFLDSYRVELKNNESTVRFSLMNPEEKMRISEIYRIAGSPKIWTDFYYLLTRKMRAERIMEMGTSLGVSGQSFLKGIVDNKQNKPFFLSFEGVPDLCEISSERFGKITDQSQFKVIPGNFDNTIDKLIGLNMKFDIIFLDGNHQYQPTIDYFNYVKNFSAKSAIIILDDINWSNNMKRAWKHILTLNYAFSIDFFKMGMIIIEGNNYKRKNYKLHLG